jgi:hypothetical protein
MSGVLTDPDDCCTLTLFLIDPESLARGRTGTGVPMNLLMMPTNEDLARERIEMAWREYDVCHACGQPMTIEVVGSSLWIECASLRSLQGVRRRLSTRFHDRHQIELPDDEMIPTAA